MDEIIDDNVEQIENGQVTAIGGTPKEHIKRRKDTNVVQNKAEVWKYFEKQKDKCTAVCTICHAVLKASGGSTSGLISHARSKHDINILKRKVIPGSSSRSHQQISFIDPSATANCDEITDFNKLRDNFAHKLELGNWFHLTSLQSVHIFNVDTKANGNLSIRNTLHINIELRCTVYMANDDIIFTVRIHHWPQLQSLIEQFGRKVKRECDAFVLSDIDEMCQGSDNKDDCGIDRKDEAVAFEFCAGNNVEANSFDSQHPLTEVEEISIVKTEPVTNDNLQSRRSQPERGKTRSRNARVTLRKRTLEKHFCSKCNETYVGKVDHHMSHRHTDERHSYECHICSRSYSYLNLKGLKRHMRSKHVTKNPPTAVNRTRVKCNICDKDFASKDSLKSHKYRHDKRNWKECLICKRGYDNLKRHMQNVHSDESTTKNQVCHICGAAYKQMSGLKKHMETKHSEDGEFFCHICENGKNYRSKWYLKKHFAIVHAYVEQNGREYSNAFECHLCNERWPSSHTLRLHIRTKHNGVEETETGFQCNIRDQKSGSKQSLDSHINEPTGTTYICQEVGRSQPFSQLKAHANQHRGLKEYKNAKKKVCSMCDKQYVAITDLRVHMMRIHGTILPIKTTMSQEMESNS